MDYFPEIEMTVSSLPRTLRWLRITREMTLEVVSKRANISVSFLSGIERGVARPSLTTLRKLALCYKTSLLLKVEPKFLEPEH